MSKSEIVWEVLGAFSVIALPIMMLFIAYVLGY